ncbi:MAG: TldD/PmbA family protein [Planctomycetota bacterium]|jgi:TldD protein
MLNRIEDVIKQYADRCDYLEVRIEEKESTNIVLRGREIDVLQESLSLGGCVRAYAKGGIGFASFNNLDRMAEFAEKAVSQAKTVGTGKTELATTPVLQAEARASVKNDPREVPVQRKLEILKGYNDLILSFDSRIPTSSVRYGDAFRRVTFGNGEGTRLLYEKLDIGGGFTAMAIGEGQTQFGSVGCGSSDDFHCLLGHEEKLKRECRAAVDMLDAPPVKGGTYTVVLDPHLAGVFVHEAFGHMSEGEKVADNPRFADVMKIGRTFGSPILNIYDTGLTEGTRGAIPYDEEGVPAQRTDLIREGVLVGRLHSRETAGKTGETVTGSARALDHTFPPIPRMRNTCIAPGEATFEEMIADIETGVYAIRAIGGQAGEMFTFTPARCFMIRKGRVEEMVKNAILSGNLFTTLKNIDRIGRDFHQHDSGGGCGKGTPDGFQFPLPVSDGAPHVRIKEIVIGGT